MTTHLPITFARPCPVCDAGFGTSLGEIHFETFKNSPIPGSFSLVVCGKCGFGFNDFPLLQTDFNFYYEDDGFYLTSGTISSGGSTNYEECRLDAFVRRLVPFIPDHESAIIDVGSSRGGLLMLLSQRGFKRLYGVDPNPTCVRYIKEVLGFEAAVGAAQSLPFEDIKSDVLIYSHIIEHAIDLKSLLRSAKERLSRDGVICVEVPDASRYQEGSVLPFQGLYLEHVNHFSPQTLINFFSEGGFELISLETISERHSCRGVAPCIWAVFRKGKTQEKAGAKRLETDLQKYISWSEKHPLIEELQLLSVKRSPIYLWGMSHYAMLILGQTPLRSCSLSGFVDKDRHKQKREVMKMPIQPPDILKGADQSNTVLITALGYEDQVMTELKDMRFAGKVLRLV